VTIIVIMVLIITTNHSRDRFYLSLSELMCSRETLFLLATKYRETVSALFGRGIKNWELFFWGFLKVVEPSNDCRHRMIRKCFFEFWVLFKHFSNVPSIVKRKFNLVIHFSQQTTNRVLRLTYFVVNNDDDD